MSFFTKENSIPLLQAARGLYASSAKGERTGAGIAGGLLGYQQGKSSQANSAKAAEQAKFDREYRQAQMAKIQAETDRFNNPLPKDRKIVKGADDFQYYADTGKRVLPNIVTPESSALDTGPFKDTKDQLGAFKSIRGEFDKTNASNKKRRDTFGTITDLVKVRGGWEGLQGADDTLLAKSFANMVLPNESVMGDDMDTINAQGGFKGLSRNVVAKLLNGDTLDPTERSLMYETMKSMHNSAVREYEENKVRAYPDVKRSGMGYGEIFQDHTVPYDSPMQDTTNLLIDPNSSDSTYDPEGAAKILRGWQLR
jgi:hypothetical protein